MEGICLFQWVEKYIVRKKGHTNIHAVGRILSRNTSVYTAVRTLRCSPSVHITDIIFQYFWFVCKKYTLMWLVTIWNSLNFFATVLRTSLLNSGCPWNSISPWSLDEWCWSWFSSALPVILDSTFNRPQILFFPSFAQNTISCFRKALETKIL